MTFFQVHQTPVAYIFFGVEAACAAVGFYFSWVAGCAVLVAILAQAGWQVYMQEQLK